MRGPVSDSAAGRLLPDELDAIAGFELEEVEALEVEALEVEVVD